MEHTTYYDIPELLLGIMALAAVAIVACKLDEWLERWLHRREQRRRGVR